MMLLLILRLIMEELVIGNLSDDNKSLKLIIKDCVIDKLSCGS